MEIKKSIKTTVTVTYETATHKISFNEEKLDDLQDAHADLLKKLHHDLKLKPNLDLERSEWRTESQEAIFEEITVQKLLKEDQQ